MQAVSRRERRVAANNEKRREVPATEYVRLLIARTLRGNKTLSARRRLTLIRGQGAEAAAAHQIIQLRAMNRD